MKLDNQCVAWINCETKEEQEKMLDIFEKIGALWPAGQSPRGNTSRTVPMHFLLERGTIRHGKPTVNGTEYYVKDTGGAVVQAKDFHNQWVSLKRIDKR